MKYETMPEWAAFVVYHRLTRFPRAWTYTRPCKYPREILLKGSRRVLGRVHRELDADGRVWYRICGTNLRYDYLGGAGSALYARYCMEKP